MTVVVYTCVRIIGVFQQRVMKHQARGIIRTICKSGIFGFEGREERSYDHGLPVIKEYYEAYKISSHVNLLMIRLVI